MKVLSELFQEISGGSDHAEIEGNLCFGQRFAYLLWGRGNQADVGMCDD